MSLLITKIKPNPAGKDRPACGPINSSQLGAEWVDFKNNGGSNISLEGVILCNVAYAPGETSGHWQEVTRFTGGLMPGQVVRVHAGQNRGLGVLRPEDSAGANFHVFTGRDQYVWNNDRGDIASLWFNARVIDRAGYDPYPPEGLVLIRQGEKLVPVGVAGYGISSFR